VRLQGSSCNRDGVGATITWSAGGVKRSRYKSNGGSYLSSHDMREVLGLGTATKLDWVEITWPRVAASTASPIPIDRRHDRRGKGLARRGSQSGQSQRVSC
jgi:hypothetical protein